MIHQPDLGLKDYLLQRHFLSSFNLFLKLDHIVDTGRVSCTCILIRRNHWPKHTSGLIQFIRVWLLNWTVSPLFLSWRFHCQVKLIHDGFQRVSNGSCACVYTTCKTIALQLHLGNLIVKTHAILQFLAICSIKVKMNLGKVQIYFSSTR